MTDYQQAVKHQKLCKEQINKMKKGIISKSKQPEPTYNCATYTTAPYDKAELKFWHYFHNFDKPNTIKYHKKMREHRVDLMEHYDPEKKVYYQKHSYDEETGDYMGFTEILMTEQVYKTIYENYMKYLNGIDSLINMIPNRFWIKK